jgi:hypothetical protein
MAENKTKETKASVDKFINSLSDEKLINECCLIISIMKDLTKEQPKMWGDSMVGFGSYHYKYESGREGDYFLTGFSPRKQNLTLYIITGFEDQREQLAKLGKHKTSKSCLYIKTLDDIDIKVLKKIISDSLKKMKKTNK